MFLSGNNWLRFFFFLFAAAPCLFPQIKPTPDVLIFVNGDKLVGRIESATGAKVVFNSDMAGEVTVPWSNIRELQSEGKFAVIPKGVQLRTGADAAKVPQGTLQVTDQKVEVGTNGATPQTVAVNNVSNLLPLPAFEQALHPQSFFRGWTGSASLGVSITKATVNDHGFNSSVNLMRSDPPQSWLLLRTRTSVDFLSHYENSYVDGAPGVKTVLYRANAVEDFFLKPRFFLFAGTSFEHNSPQGLDLMQAYGGGVGAVLLKGERSELDARAGLGFMDQQFTDSSLNHKLIGSRFAEDYTRTFGHGVTLFEQAGVRPAWNYERAFFGGFLISLTVPVYHHLGLNVTTFDSFINDPPPGFKKNSYQLTVGANYAIK